MGNSIFIRAGVGLDIGTTTVQAQLVNLDTGECLDTFSALNDQRGFGADVITRIAAARNGKLDELFFEINKQVEGILQYFLNRRKLAVIERCNVTGNTTMLHLFCHADPSSMGESPFTPFFLDERNFAGKELSLSAEHIKLLPGISAFVGADIAAGLAFVEIMEKGEDALFVDIGTNGEIAVWKHRERRLLCCSTAAGSCFDREETTGARIVDIMAEMKKLEIIDETGALCDDYIRTGYPVPEGFAVTQKDVRQFQLAKAAIFSGIKVICNTAGILPENIGTSYICGGLGFHVNLENAGDIGLIPKELIKNARVCGNTSLLGAVKSLTDSTFLPRCREIAANSTTIDLANDKAFCDEYTSNMWF